MAEQQMNMAVGAKDISVRGKIVSWPTKDGIVLEFMAYNEDSETEISEKGWWGPSVNFLYEIYNKYKNKPVKVTISLTE